MNNPLRFPSSSSADGLGRPTTGRCPGQAAACGGTVWRGLGDQRPRFAPEHHRGSADAGRTLRELMERQPEEILGGKAASSFPWLIKYLDACDWLSVQVHPDEEAVLRLWPGEGSKTEAWFILAAQPGSRVYAGLRPGVDEKELRAALATGTVAECLHQWEPRPGDCLFLPAGTVHAVGGGVLIAEVQQTSDATFRLFDWNRRDSSGAAASCTSRKRWRASIGEEGPLSRFGQTATRRKSLDGFALQRTESKSVQRNMRRSGSGWLSAAISSFPTSDSTSHSVSAVVDACRR